MQGFDGPVTIHIKHIGDRQKTAVESYRPADIFRYEVRIVRANADQAIASTCTRHS
jgi:hypothetical protein